MLNVLIVDDEEPAHEVLLHHLATVTDMRVVGRCYDAAEALKVLAQEHIDLLLLDIRMPGFGGLDLLRGLGRKPLTIIVSAHRNHALDGYELDVVDYLLKPVTEERFSTALEKFRRRLNPDAAAGDADQAIVVKVDRSTRRLLPRDIACFEANGNYVRIWTGADRSILATDTLRRLIDEVPPGQFLQVHKSFVVNRSRVTEKHSDRLVLDTGMSVPVGKTFRSARDRILPET